MNCEECIKHARECIARADQATDNEAKAEYLKVAQEWTLLATELAELEKPAHVFGIE